MRMKILISISSVITDLLYHVCHVFVNNAIENNKIFAVQHQGPTWSWKARLVHLCIQATNIDTISLILEIHLIRFTYPHNFTMPKSDAGSSEDEGPPKSSFDIYRAEGESLMKNGEYPKAIECFTQVWFLFQSNINLLNITLYCLIKSHFIFQIRFKYPVENRCQSSSKFVWNITGNVSSFRNRRRMEFL